MVRIERQGAVWTIVHSRYEAARNAMDPASADALVDAFSQFDSDGSASVLRSSVTLSRAWLSRPARTLRRGVRSVPPASNSRSRSSRQWKAPPSQGAWSLPCGATSA